MLAFEIIGAVLVVLFMSALITGEKSARGQ